MKAFLIKRIWRLVRYKGNRFFCPLCRNSYRQFLPFGIHERPNAMCPGCESLERHRLLVVALNRLWESDKIKKSGLLLHIAPEKALGERLKSYFEYLSVDMDGSKAMRQMDITAINLLDETFDAIVCNHVLEHIPDDRKALSELYRVLKHGGWSSIQVPMKDEITREDRSITDPQERERLYGQSDHVRQYGRDFRLRLEGAGFKVLVFPKEELLDRVMLKNISVECETDVWICLK